MIARRLVLALPLVIQCVASSADSSRALTISDVQVDRRQFDPKRGEKVAIRYRLSRPASVQVRWFDPRDLLIRTVTSHGEMPTGESTLSWDGKDQAGRSVPAEAYHYTLVASTADGARQEFDLTDVTIGQDFEISQIALDPNDHSLRYTLSSWSRVNLRIGLHDGPLLRSLVNWGVRGPGQHVEPWDGKDASGVMHLADSKGLKLWGMAFSLPDNAVIVGDTNRDSQVIAELPWGRVERVKKQAATKRMYAHSQQSHHDRPDFVATLRRRGIATDPTGTSPVTVPRDAITPIEVVVPSSVASRLAQQRFESVYFIDGQFVQENEIAVLPATWNVNGRSLSPGEHYLTVNLRGYEGAFGYGSLKVRVPEENEQASGSSPTGLAQGDDP